MKTIEKILARYTNWVKAILLPLGIWGVFVIAALDAGAFGLPMDIVVAGYVYTDRGRFLLYVLMASAGSALGSLVLYGIGYVGGEAVLRKRISEARFLKIHRSFEDHPFWALMAPAIMPPPTPFKLFVLAAAVFEMKISEFLLAIFSGRFIRFLILALLTLKFGPQFVELSGNLLHKHGYLVLGVIAAGLLIWFVIWQKGRTRPADQ